MLKSGLIVGAVSLIMTIIAGAGVSPMCGFCVGIFAGLAAGYLAGLFDKPADSGGSAKSGASAGAIAGVGALIGLVVAGAINALLVGPEGAAAITEAFGLPTSPDPTSYYVGAVVGPCCLGILNLALMAGLGALGGMLWYQTGGKTQTPAA